MLTHYKNIIVRYCNFFEDPMDKRPDPAITAAYFNIVEEKEEYRENWNNLIADLEECGKYYRIRDCSPPTLPHCFRVVLPFYKENYEGLMLCISMMGKLIGMYFSDLTKGALVPIYLNCNTPNVVSYYPFSSRQEEEARFVLDLVYKHFPAFEKFDNTYASIPVRNVTLGEHTYREVDLFQTIFSANVHGMI
jgi:hypothetical protein